MDPYFRAFSFVDRITSISDGGHVRGQYTIPAGLDEFPTALVGEAVGQLAAWAAMDATDFNHRPVAGLAGGIDLLGQPVVGQVLELAAELEHVDGDSVQYNGSAHVNGTVLVRLRDCVGPMMPLAEFDDPRSLRNRFELLCRTGAPSGGFCGLLPLKLERAGGCPGQSASATFQVPSTAPFFADHFPRRPVFPGSLLMHLSIQLGATLANEIPPAARRHWVPEKIVDMKLRSFIPPGVTLRLDANLKRHSHESAILGLETRTTKEMVASAELELRAWSGV